MQETPVRSLIQEDPTGQGATKPLWVTAIEPVLSSLGATTSEAHTP